MLPHDKTDGKRTPGFFISTSNMTYLSMKGKDWRGSRIGNVNSKSGWKNRLEYAVTASKGATKISLIMNTSVILPPITWTVPIFGEDAPKNKHISKDPKKKSSRKGRSSSCSLSNSSRNSHSRRESREKGRSRRDESPERPPPRLKEAKPVKVHQFQERDHRHRHSRERRRRRPHVDPGYIDGVDVS
ncbi:uncharacterized protein RSE6_07240 [Rhynchosporium secalis]|uniref:Uncharacterized protein n=1 Tax=Rhynchosporium secalis TaxID=38038 RepID=A0A1E1MDF5_RHYSE|nr:uncharacterized protein RSE6_07240 [Rhynchosporium secalis]